MTTGDIQITVKTDTGHVVKQRAEFDGAHGAEGIITVGKDMVDKAGAAASVLDGAKAIRGHGFHSWRARIYESAEFQHDAVCHEGRRCSDRGLHIYSAYLFPEYEEILEETGAWRDYEPEVEEVE